MPIKTLKRIKYASLFSSPMSVGEIEELGRQCALNNKDKELTGVLMASGGLFFQVLEGPEEAVDETFAQICSDERHRDVTLLETKLLIADRLFPDWAMKTISLDSSRASRLEPLHVILEVIVDTRQTLDRLIGGLERALWNELQHGVDRLERGPE